MDENWGVSGNFHMGYDNVLPKYTYTRIRGHNLIMLKNVCCCLQQTLNQMEERPDVLSVGQEKDTTHSYTIHGCLEMLTHRTFWRDMFKKPIHFLVKHMFFVDFLFHQSAELRVHPPCSYGLPSYKPPFTREFAHFSTSPIVPSSPTLDVASWLFVATWFPKSHVRTY